MQDNSALRQEQARLTEDVKQLQMIVAIHQNRLSMLVHVLEQQLSLPVEVTLSLADVDGDFEACAIEVQDTIAHALQQAAEQASSDADLQA
jgi:hypothetical protein